MKEYKLCGELQLRPNTADVPSSVVICEDVVVNNVEVWIKRLGLVGKKVELTVKVLE